MNVQFIDTNDWQETFWLHSGGTREKRILLDPQDKLWFFKRSERKPAQDGKPGKYYKDEFWSEIIAYQIGNFLRLDVLRYDVALSNGQLGCLSPSMIDVEKEKLVEIGRYMITYNPDFSPELRATRREYTYDLLSRTLEHFQLSHFKFQILQTLVFDSLIGNSDRHQENWAFISDNTTIPDEDIDIFPMIKRIHQNQQAKDLQLINKEFELRKSRIINIAPIYDSGSSLARELDEDKIKKILKDQNMLDAYIRRGTSELHWIDKSKVPHFTLIEYLKNLEGTDMIRNAARFLENWDENVIYKIVNEIDDVLPEEHGFYQISRERKELIFKLLTLRFERITEIIHG